MTLIATSLWSDTITLEQKQQWARDNPHVCPLPFTNHGLAIEFNGSTNPDQQKAYLKHNCCCNMIGDGDFEEVRQSIRNKQPHARCSRCHESERQIGSSERSLALVQQLPQQINSLLKQEPLYFSFGLKFSNLCNLACRSCSPAFSSRYAAIRDIRLPEIVTNDIADDPEHWHTIIGYLRSYATTQNLTLNLFGGESLIQPGAHRVLSWMIDQGLHQQVSLHVGTNFTQVQRPIMDVLMQFRHIRFSASLDSIDENFEYTRWPAKWASIQDNLKLIRPYLDDSKISFTVTPLINLNNVFYINDILDYWHAWQESNHYQCLEISNVMMFRPLHMTIQNLPVQYRGFLLDKIRLTLSSPILRQGQNQALRHYLENLTPFLETGQTIYDQFELYLYDTAFQDRLHGTSMIQGNSRFYHLLSDYHQQMYQDFLDGSREISFEQQQIKDSLPL